MNMRNMCGLLENCGEYVRWKRTGDEGGKWDWTIEQKISSLLGRDEVEREWTGNSK
jgi:hypothetical protein